MRRRIVRPRSTRGAARARAAGFTLIEVLVALAIIGVALMASIRATGSLASSSETLRMRTLALWSADNRLAMVRIQAEQLPLGRRTFDCSQMGVPLSCQEEVLATPNQLFRQVIVTVVDSRDNHRLARLVAFPGRL
ncbi:MAG: type II secretion system minor pseudopilin GspI [Burkholderiaceae bacterium]